MTRRRIRRKKGSKLFIYAMIVFLLVPFIYNSTVFSTKKKELIEKKAILEEKLEEEVSLTALYQDEISKFGSPEHYEYLARKYLGYIYPDETVIVVDPQQPNEGDLLTDSNPEVIDIEK
ncbi:MAG: hypothetical protein FWG10_06940 [Eubacteriaceae bacterium]|nr:hypothetical protein [Eubacteriaceae bacterium]